MPVIDIHTHAFPGKIAVKTMAALQAGTGISACGDGTVADLLASMDAAGVDRSVVCNIATRPEQMDNILAWCREIRSPRIEPFPSVHPDAPDAATAVERIAEEGFAGIKLHPMYQEFHLDDARIEPICAAARDCGLIVLMHCGFDIAFRDDTRAGPAAVRELADRWAGLKILCAHLGGWQAWEEACRHLVGADVYLDTSLATPFLALDRVRAIIERHGPGRVLFGTDWPWGRQDESLADLAECGLSDEALQLVRGQNADDLLARR